MTQRMFSHEKPDVYQKALVSLADAEIMLNSWEGKHAVVDHHSPASESIIMNLADGAVPALERGSS